MSSLLRAEVSSAALRSNLARIRAVAPGRRVLAVIKANAYGHGLVSTARCLEGADALAVARLEEALVLRRAGIRSPIVLLEGVFDAASLAEAARQQLELVVHDEAQIALLEAADPAWLHTVWLKIDTGMNRLGFRVEAFAAAYQRLRALGPRLARLRLLTHLASADRPDSTQTDEQLRRFALLRAGCPEEVSIANSAALFSRPDSHGDWVRPGIALYGVSPFADRDGQSLGLMPAMRLVSTVIAMRDVPRGETVGYGGSWRAERDARIAIVAAGYGDGLPWSLPSGTPVMVDGRPRPLVGRVSMDMIAVDVTGTGVKSGDPVVLWGPELPVERTAAAARTIAWELLCAVSQRVPLVLL
ncbi:MAG: alanine racemase [Steroidobacteraceae bacterium]